MNTILDHPGSAADADCVRASALERYRRVRAVLPALCRPLAIEDYGLQAMADASPPKWHLAHVSWFFETFILKPFDPAYRALDPAYEVLFNSYYNGVGPQFPRARRGLLSRPTVEEVYAYRAHVDDAMTELIARAGADAWNAIGARLELGLQHEQQHQELFVYDHKYNLSVNPLKPAYRDDLEAARAPAPALEWLDVAGGIAAIGHAGAGFAFDNEGPRHRVLLDDFRLASRPVTNGEYRAFIDDGGYAEPALWLADGWAALEREGWRAPLYWVREGSGWRILTLAGERALDDAEPVCHVSFYEADAFARWAGKRLPREEEWERAAHGVAVRGNFLESGRFHPAPGGAGAGGVRQLYGDVWEWTASPYTPYPGYVPAAGALGEYNGKFMSGQMVLRGGSCATPGDHIRPSYRNFFYPHQRWMMAGVRLAETAS